MNVTTLVPTRFDLHEGSLIIIIHNFYCVYGYAVGFGSWSATRCSEFWCVL